MHNTQKCLVELLSLSIRGRKAPPELCRNVDWIELLELAQAHSVLPLIYTSMSVGCMPSNLLPEWKRIVYQSLLKQARNYTIIQKIIGEFKKSNIELLAMKGLVLRNYYPNPDTRTMCDYDLSVRENDLSAAVELLIKMGFSEIGEGRTIHVKMEDKSGLLLEIHRQPFDGTEFGVLQSDMDEFWNRAATVSIGDNSVLTYSDNDMLLYLFIHLAKHYELGGFGLRQLCDIVLFIEAKGETINWEQFCLRSMELNISRFAHIVIVTCNCLFHMQIPELIKKYVSIDDKRVKQFIQDIIEGGVYGKATSEHKAGSRILSRVDYQYYNRRNKFSFLLKFLFPAPDKLPEKQVYARNHPLLLPIAWIHRWLYNIVNRNQRNMIKTMLNRQTARESLKIMETRREFIYWLLVEERKGKTGKAMPCGH